MSDKIQVVIRQRPLNESEKQNGCDLMWKTSENRIISAVDATNHQSYMFDRVYDNYAETADIYHETVKPIICASMEGFNGTIFAYGQTSSGKTYTMSGTKESQGIIPMAMETMFAAIDNAPNRQFLLRVSYMEIYNEKITDLLDPSYKSLKLMEDENRLVHVSGLKEMVLQNIDDMLDIKKKGDARRRVAETSRNEESSRSHAIFRMIIESQERQDNDEDLRDESVRLSLLYFIDLAGSEKCSENSGDRFREGCAINKSLLVLGQVISKLSDGVSNLHINYRDSKLTRILQNALGGNSKTAIICTINPTVVDETHSTLRFASRAKTINNQPKINEITDVSNKAILKRYQQEIQQLKKQLESYQKQTPQKNLNPCLGPVKPSLDLDELKRKYQHTINALKQMICVSTTETKEEKINRRKTWCPGLLKRKLEPLVPDHSMTPGRHLASIAETPAPEDQGRLNRKGNVSLTSSSYRKRITFDQISPKYVNTSVQTESRDEHEMFLKFENEMLRNQLTLKKSEPSAAKKRRVSFSDHNETKEFLELELQCITEETTLKVDEEQMAVDKKKLDENILQHRKEVHVFDALKAELMQKVECTETENLHLLSKLQSCQERVKNLEEELNKLRKSDAMDGSSCSISEDLPVLNLSNITRRSATRSARMTNRLPLPPQDEIPDAECEDESSESKIRKISVDLQTAKDKVASKSEEITFLSSENQELKLRIDALVQEKEKLDRIVEEKTPIFEQKEYVEIKTQLVKVHKDNEKLSKQLQLKSEEVTFLSRLSAEQPKLFDNTFSRLDLSPSDNNNFSRLDLSAEGKVVSDIMSDFSQLQQQFAAANKEKDEILLRLAAKEDECAELQQNVDAAHYAVVEMQKSLREIREQLLAKNDIDVSQIDQLDVSMSQSLRLSSVTRRQSRHLPTVQDADLEYNVSFRSSSICISRRRSSSIGGYSSSSSRVSSAGSGDMDIIASSIEEEEEEEGEGSRTQDRRHEIKDSEIVKQLEEKLSAKTLELCELKEKEEKHKGIVKVLEEKLSEKTEELCKLKETKDTDIINELEGNSSEYLALTEELMELRENKIMDGEILKELEERLSEMARELQEAKEGGGESIKTLQEELSKKTQDYQSLHSEMCELRESKLKGDEILKELELELSEKTQHYQSLHSEMCELRESKLKGDEILKELELELSEKTQHYQSLHSEMCELRESKLKGDEILKELELKLSEKTQDYQSLHSELIEVKESKLKENEILKEREQKLLEMAGELCELKEMKTEDRESTTEIEEDSQKYVALSEELRELKENKIKDEEIQKELEEKLSKMAQELSELKEMKDEHGEIVKNLEEKLNQKTLDCQSLHSELMEVKESKLKENEILKEREQKLSEMAGELCELKEMKDEHSEIVKNLEEKLSEKTQDCRTLYAEMTEVRENKMQTDETLKNLEEKLSEKTQELLSLKEMKMEDSEMVKELEEKSQKCLALSAEQTELKLKVEEIQNDLEEKTQELCKLEEMRKEFDGIVKDLEEKLSEKTQDCQTLYTELAEVHENKMKTDQTLKELEEKFSEKTQELFSLKEVEVKYGKIVKELEEKTREAMTLSEEFMELQENKIMNGEILEELEERLSEMARELQEAKEGGGESVKTLQEELSKKTQDYQSLHSEMCELRESKLKGDEILKELELKLSEKTQDYQSLHSELIEVKESKLKENEILKEREQKLSEMAGELCELKEMKDEHSEIVKNLEEKLNQKTLDCQSLDTELSELKECKVRDSGILREMEEKLSEKTQELLSLKEMKMDDSEMVKELEEKSQKCLALSAEQTELKLKVEEILNDLEEKTQELYKLEEMKKEFDGIVKDLEEKLSEKTQELRKLTDDNDEKHKEIEELKLKALEMARVNELRSSETVKPSEQLETQGGTSQSADVSSLQSQLREKEERCSRLSEKLETLEKDVAEKLDRLKKLNHKSNTQSERIEILTVKAELAAELHEELAKEQEKNERLEDELETLKETQGGTSQSADVSSLQSQLREKEERCSRLSEKLETLEKDVAEKLDRLKKLNHKSNTQSERIEILAVKAELAEELREELEKQIEKNEKLEEELERHKETQGGTSQSADVSSLQSQLREKEERCSRLSEKLETLEKDVAEKLDRLKKLNHKSNTQSERIEILAVKAELAEELREELEKQIEKNDRLEEELERHKELPPSSSPATSSKQQEIQNLQEEIKQCSSRIEELNTENTSCKETIAKLESLLKEKQECIDNTATKSATELNAEELENTKKQLRINFMNFAQCKAERVTASAEFNRKEESYKSHIEFLENMVKNLKEEKRLRSQQTEEENTIAMMKEAPLKASKSNVAIPARGFVDQLAITTLEADNKKLKTSVESYRQKLYNSLKNNQELKKELIRYKDSSSLTKLSVANKATGKDIPDTIETASSRTPVPTTPFTPKTPYTPSPTVRDSCTNQ
ncbi:hypothetical protein Ahia01_001048500 [Argonauta hians]